MSLRLPTDYESLTRAITPFAFFWFRVSFVSQCLFRLAYIRVRVFLICKERKLNKLECDRSNLYGVFFRNAIFFLCSACPRIPVLLLGGNRALETTRLGGAHPRLLPQ